MCSCDQLRKLVAQVRPVGRMSLEPCVNLPIKKKQRNLAILFKPFPLLEFLSTAGKLLRYLCGSYLLPDRNPSF